MEGLVGQLSLDLNRGILATGNADTLRAVWVTPELPTKDLSRKRHPKRTE